MIENEVATPRFSARALRAMVLLHPLTVERVHRPEGTFVKQRDRWSFAIGISSTMVGTSAPMVGRLPGGPVAFR